MLWLTSAPKEFNTQLQIRPRSNLEDVMTTIGENGTIKVNGAWSGIRMEVRMLNITKLLGLIYEGQSKSSWTLSTALVSFECL